VETAQPKYRGKGGGEYINTSRSSMASWAGFHNHLIRLKFNPKYFRQNQVQTDLLGMFKGEYVHIAVFVRTTQQIILNLHSQD